MSGFDRNNLKFNTSKEEQRQAHDFLGKIGRGQSQFVALLIKNFLVSCGIESSEELTVEEVKKIVSGFQKLMEPENDYMQRMIDSGQYISMATNHKQSVTDYNMGMTLSANMEYGKQPVTDCRKIADVKSEKKQSVTDYEETSTDEEDVSDPEDIEETDGEESEYDFDFADDLMAQLSVFSE